MTRRKGTAEEYVLPPRAHPDGHRLLPGALRRATSLVTIVRDEGAEGVARVLDRCDTQDLYAIVTVLAALVPDDRSTRDLLAWFHEPTATPEAS